MWCLLSVLSLSRFIDGHVITTVMLVILLEMTLIFSNSNSRNSRLFIPFTLIKCADIMLKQYINTLPHRRHLLEIVDDVIAIQQIPVVEMLLVTIVV